MDNFSVKDIGALRVNFVSFFLTHKLIFNESIMSRRSRGMSNHFQKSLAKVENYGSVRMLVNGLSN